MTKKQKPAQACAHPPARIFTAIVPDVTSPTGKTIWGGCCDCGTVVYCRPFGKVKKQGKKE